MVDAARLADELRAEQEHAQTQEKMRKGLELSVKELQTRLEEFEATAHKTAEKPFSKLEARIRDLETQLDDEARRHADAQKNLRKCERRIKELSFQSEEDKKNHERMQDLVDKLHRDQDLQAPDRGGRGDRRPQPGQVSESSARARNS
ncbi:myosin heavy chain type 6a [Penaeus vannamei]|uniref:Paramyosin n=1 Tax=Penaeus vannamei TaxID=6689 RepID=A0A3R7PQQ1_PENVA|nr:myosin heavy chain type 6a [Penaeus vannamei]